jgi:hypothetical protein
MNDLAALRAALREAVETGHLAERTLAELDALTRPRHPRKSHDSRD